MDTDLFIALVSALVNMILSVIIPCALKKTEQPFLKDLQKVFSTNREVIIASSLIVAITVYLALKVAPEIELAFSDDNNFGFSPRNTPAFLRGNIANLIKLRDF